MTNDGADKPWLTALATALYRTLLLREPDAWGLEQNAAHFAAQLERGESVDDMIVTFLNSDEFGRNLPQFLRRYGAGRLTQFVIDQSQYGEVELLLQLMVNGGASHRIVVDVGANGRERSNSYDLLRHFGWRGLLIEANPGLIGKIVDEFAGLDVTVINTAVADRTGTATLHIGVNDDVSSLTEQNARNWGETRGKVEVPVTRLSSLLADQAIPLDFDLLSIDAEGEDVAILNDAVAHGYRPRWVVIEASYDFSTQDLNGLPFSLAVRESYRIVAQTRANLILGRMDQDGRAAGGVDILTSQR